jgi:hypothetical protein
LARATFPFSKQESEAFGYITRPVIRVTLRAESGELFDTTALLDSGADVSMFSPSIAQIMGLKVRRGNRKIFRGLGGKVEAYLHRIHLKVGPLQFYARVAFPTVEIPNLVGRLDIMKGVDVIFKDERQITMTS